MYMTVCALIFSSLICQSVQLYAVVKSVGATGLALNILENGTTPSTPQRIYINKLAKKKSCKMYLSLSISWSSHFSGIVFHILRLNQDSSGGQ